MVIRYCVMVMPLTFYYSYFPTHTDINAEVQRRRNNSLQAQVNAKPHNNTQEGETCCWEGTFTPTHPTVESHLAFDDTLLPMLFHLILLRRIWVLLSQLNSPMVEKRDGDVRISWNQDPEEAQLGRGHGEKRRGDMEGPESAQRGASRVGVGGCCSGAQSCLPLCGPMDCSLPYSSIQGTFQARILEWVVISHSRESTPSRDWILVYCVGRWMLNHWATLWDPSPGWEGHAVSRLRHRGLLLISMIIPAPVPGSQIRVHCLSVRPEDFLFLCWFPFSSSAPFSQDWKGTDWLKLTFIQVRSWSCDAR